MSTTAKTESRRKSRKTGVRGIVRLQLKDGSGHPRWITADLIDLSEEGIGVSLIAPLPVGAPIVVRGKLRENEPEAQLPAEVRWCAEQPSGSFRAGLVYVSDQASFGGGQSSKATADSSELDCYEAMQLSPNADSETIHRVYRLLAQRYHPDNADTGDNELFVRLTEAYAALSDPERRAKYDTRHREIKQLHWKIFDQAQTTTGVEAEKRKRRGILGLLHAKTLHDPEHPAMNIFQFEELLGCPREHLQAALWYLRGKDYIQRADNGRYSITVHGFDEAEVNALSSSPAHVKLVESAK